LFFQKHFLFTFLFLFDLYFISRNEIADCSEKAYDSLPIASAIKLMYFDGQHDFLEFAKEVRLFIISFIISFLKKKKSNK